MREGHSSGKSVGVQVVLSTHALYVVAPLPRGAKPRHSMKYTDIYTIIVSLEQYYLRSVCQQYKKHSLSYFVIHEREQCV